MLRVLPVAFGLHVAASHEYVGVSAGDSLVLVQKHVANLAPWTHGDNVTHLYERSHGHKVELIGLLEYPYSGSTWLRYLVAGAAGFPTCSNYKEDQSSCVVQGNHWEAHCPCNAENYAKFSPRGWKDEKENTNEGSSRIHDAFEYIPGIRVHEWSMDDQVMVRKSHLFDGQDEDTPEITKLDGMVWLVRHPLDILAADQKYRGNLNPEGLNKYYANVYKLSTSRFADRSLILTYESMCADTAGAVVKVLEFLNKPADKSAIQKMLKDWPELACRYSYRDLAPAKSTLESFGKSANDLKERSKPAEEIWKKLHER